MKITLEMVEKQCLKHSCDVFAQLFPEGMEVTLENLQLAQDNGIGPFCFAGMIPEDKKAAYGESVASALQAHIEADAKANQERKATEAPAQKVWDVVCNELCKAHGHDPNSNVAPPDDLKERLLPTWRAFEKVRDEARDVFIEARLPSLKAYEETMKKALVVAFADN